MPDIFDQAHEEMTGKKGLKGPSAPDVFDMAAQEGFETKGGPKPEKTFRGFMSNILPSAATTLESIASPITSPIRTAKGLGKLAVGAATLSHPLPPIAADVLGHPEQVSSEVWDALKQRYGSMEAIKETAYKDPVGFAADLSAVLAGGAGALKLAGKGAELSGLSRTGTTLRTTSKAASGLSKITDPLNIGIKTTKAITSPVTKLAGRGIKVELARLSGTGTEAINEALKGTPTFKSIMRDPNGAQRVLSDVREAVSNLEKVKQAEYTSRASQIPQNIQVDLIPVKDAFKKRLGEFNVTESIPGLPPNVKIRGPMPRGMLDFSGSSIPAGSAGAKVIRQAYNDLMDWGLTHNTNLTPTSVDTLKQRISEYLKETKSPKARAVIQDMVDKIRTELGNQVPGYEEMTSEYHAASELGRKIEKELKVNSKNPSIAMRRLSKVMAEEPNYSRTIVDALQQYSPEDLRAGMSGLTMAPTKPGYLGAMGGTLGALTGHPASLAMLALTSPRSVGEAMVALSNAKRAGRALTPKPSLYRPAGYVNAAAPKPPEPPKESVDVNSPIEQSRRRFSAPAPPSYYGPPISPIEALARKYGIER